MMDEDRHSYDKTVSPEVGLRLEEVCSRFERDWQQGPRPRVEDYLAGFSGEDQSALARELIGLDIDYRRGLGEEPQAEDYMVQIPALGRGPLEKLLSTARPPRQKTPSTAKPPPSTGAGSAAQSPPTGKRVRCPHCQNPIQLSDDRSEDVLCPGCGNGFRFCDTHTTQSVDPMRPLGKYQLLERVGLGSFGAVWRARDTELDRIVALKIPHTGLMTSPTELERWHREGRAAAQLRHPGIVAVHDVTTLEGLPIIVTDFIAGVTLRDLLQVRRLAFREAALLTAQVAEALDHAHSRGLVHRDVKPANIMLEHVTEDDGAAGRHRPLVMDFGLALRSEIEVLLTQDGQIVGTPAYMSPEQAAGKAHEADCRCDVYSLGVVLYELLAGELPFRGSRAMMIHQVLHEEPRPVRRLNDKVPRDLETICLKSLAKERERRYPNCRTMADDLHRFLAGDPIKARPVGRVERLWRWCRRNRLAASLLAALVLVFVGGFAGVAVNMVRAETNWALAVDANRDLVKEQKTSNEYWENLQKQRKIQDAQDKKKAEHLSALRIDCQKHLDLGLVALKRDDWQQAKIELQVVQNSIDADADNRGDAGLKDLRRWAGEAQEEADQALIQVIKRVKLAKEKAEFRKLLDEMQFQAADIEPETQRMPYFDAAKGEKAGQAALALADTWGPGLDGLAPEDRVEFKSEVRDLLLLLVQAKLQRPGSNPEVLLAMLDRAKAMGGPSHTYHRLRAEVLKGDKAQADTERQLAAQVAPATALDHFLLGQDKRRQWQRLGNDLAREVQEKKHSTLAEAAEQYHLAAVEKPNHFWAQIQMGRCYLALGRLEEGAAVLETCIGLRPDSPWGYSASGFAMILLKRYSEAERYLKKGINSPVARLHLAVLHFLKKEDKVALTQFAALLAAPKGERLVEALYYQAQLHFDRGMLSEAIDDLGKFLAESKDFAPAYLLRAQAQFTKGNAAGGMTDLGKYVEIVDAAPQGSRAMALRGRELRRNIPYWGLQLQQSYTALSAAKAELTNAIQGGEKSAAVYDDLGNVLVALMTYHKKGEPKDLIAPFTAAIQLDPQDPQLRINRGWAFKAVNENNAARADFAAAIKINPDLAEAHTGLGYLLALQGDLIGAHLHAELAVANGAHNYQVFHNVACIHALLAESDRVHQSDHRAAAFAMIKRAIELWMPQREASGRNYLQDIEDEQDFEKLKGLPEYKELIRPR